MNFFYSNEIDNNTIVLRQEEFKHALKSLRKKINDQLFVTDGNGKLFNCTLTEIKKDFCEARIDSVKTAARSEPELCMAVAPTKNMNKFEWFVEKSVELGVSRICPIYTNNSERRKIRVDRLRKIVLSAMKQSKRLFLPQIDELVSLDEFVNADDSIEKYLCHYQEDGKHLKTLMVAKNPTTILIGPEGDFTNEEFKKLVSMGYFQANLGDYILRVETAALFACNIFNLANQ